MQTISRNPSLAVVLQIDIGFQVVLFYEFTVKDNSGQSPVVSNHFYLLHYLRKKGNFPVGFI